jgi:hypothetical protein
MTSSIHARNSSEKKALAALDTYMQSARSVTNLYDAAGTHLSCLGEYFCAYDPDEKTIRADKPCYDVLRTYGEAYANAFGVNESRWFGDVFGWVVYGGTADYGSEEEISSRVARIDQVMIDNLSEFDHANGNNPVASIIIRDYYQARKGSCCEEVKLFFDWFNTLTFVPFPTSSLQRNDVRWICK